MTRLKAERRVNGTGGSSKFSARAARGPRAQSLRKRAPLLSRRSRDPRDEPAVGPSAKPPLYRQRPTSMFGFDELLRPSSGTHSRSDEGPSQAKERLEKMSDAVKTLLECMGEDPNREGLLATPSRYAKALLFLTKGYHDSVEGIVNNALFSEKHNEMVIVKDIEFHSLCEHHLLPFTGKMHIGYVPSGTVIGLSKLPRIAEAFSRRLQIQERLTNEVAGAIMNILKPQGVGVVIESRHLCMVMRGVEKTGTTTMTSCVLGCFESNFKTRTEFLRLVGDNKTVS
ncbi:hypothetical protein Purlil1_12479 [Purpureocillium lilacinum]|uniref:GTP cyclohydrolase 1 n=1 Tax=Purpureocillium lilacinum TaxID=33203 RepID=A0ABR0BGS0_PURLI|nr:hypothetical protein Purlil1_12479 [Purpureocillium lilacinum]